MLPEGARVDEHLVVKAGGEEAGEELRVQLAHIIFEARPMVLRLGRKAREQLGGGGALVRLKAVAGPEAHQRVRLLRSRGDETARAVIFERAPDQHLVIGEKRRGERVPGETLEFLTVEGKLDLFGAVDETTLFGETRAHDATLSRQEV